MHFFVLEESEFRSSSEYNVTHIYIYVNCNRSLILLLKVIETEKSSEQPLILRAAARMQC